MHCLEIQKMMNDNSSMPFFFRPFPLLLICLLLGIILLTESALAQTWYIKPSAEFPLRRGQGTDYRILAIVPDGTAVTIVEEADSWVKVKTEDDKEGWILKRYLSQDKPLIEVVEALQQENNLLKEEIDHVKKQNDEFGDFNIALKNTLDQTKADLESTSEKYEKLKSDTADVVAIKNGLDQSKQTITALQQELGTITAENHQLKASQNIKWFLAGGGTLIFGCIVGLMSARSRKRKSSLY